MPFPLPVSAAELDAVRALVRHLQCPLELKCSATGKPGALFVMLVRCSPKRSLRVHPVSPM